MGQHAVYGHSIKFHSYLDFLLLTTVNCDTDQYCCCCAGTIHYLSTDPIYITIIGSNFKSFSLSAKFAFVNL
jgi:hypothetical protein